MPPDPRLRFSDRVAEYVLARPRYPDALVPLLRERLGLESDWTVADIGAGTGFSAEPFLRNGNAVIGIEPNPAMRAAAHALYPPETGLSLREGEAERTGLDDASVDLVVAGQAFHWFDRARAGAEFSRILKPPRPVALFWNSRRTGSDPFLIAYERLLVDFGTDYGSVRHDRLNPDEWRAFFTAGHEYHTLPNEQRLDRAGLRARLLSSSYVPAKDQPRAQEMLERLDEIFDAHEEDGRVRILYDTEIHLGRV